MEKLAFHTNSRLPGLPAIFQLLTLTVVYLFDKISLLFHEEGPALSWVVTWLTIPFALYDRHLSNHFSTGVIDNSKRCFEPGSTINFP